MKPWILTDEEYVVYADEKVSNIISDETARIIDTRPPYADWAHAYGIIKEEIEETSEEVDILQDSLNRYWKLVREDAPDEELIERLEVIRHIATNTINEAKQVAAVVNKAIQQLSTKKENIDVASYKLEQAVKAYEKSSCHSPK